MKSIALLLCVVAFATLGHAVTYNGYQVVRFHFTTTEQFQYLLKMKEVGDSPLIFFQVSNLEKYADIMIPPAFVATTVERLVDHGMTSEVLIADVQKTIDASA